MVAVALALAATFMWGASFILIKMGLEEIPPLTLAALRFSLAALILLAYQVSRFGIRENRSYLKKRLGMLSAIGLTGVTLPNALQNIGMQYTMASLSSILMATGPVYVVVLSVVFLGESLGFRKSAGVALALLGAIALSSGGDVSMLRYMTSQAYGNLLVLFSAITYGPSTILAKMEVKDREPILVLGWSTALGALFLLPFSLIFESGKGIFSIGAGAWAIVTALAVFPTALAFFFWFEALRAMEASRLSLFIFLIPVFATLFASVFLGEAITAFMVVTAFIVFFGVYLAQTEVKKEKGACTSLP